jgi:nicotinamidase-related amidase
MNPALVVIDVQKDYFEQGMFPLANAQRVLENIANAIEQAKRKKIPIVLIQHIADPAGGPAPFFNANTSGADIHPRILEVAGDAPVVIKHFADSFERTQLQSVLESHHVDTLLVCGMMTQNCVTHTAISKAADAYRVTVLEDCCTTVSEILHAIAIHGLSTRVAIAPWRDAILAE